MTNNHMNTNRKQIRRSSDRARAITKAKAKKQNIIISTTAIALVAVTAACFLIFGGAFSPKTATAAAQSVPAASVSVAKDANKAAQNTRQADSQTATQAAQADDTATIQTVSNDDSDQNYTPAQSSDSNSDQDTQSQDRIDTVNGERIYIDTKRTAPDGAGAPAHFYANGKTSYGFDWNYDADNSNFVIRCNYNFDEQQYDFQFYGTAPGTSHITVFYNTDDNTQATADLTLVVDNNLNASIA